jgi:hypothetical protein
MKTTRLLILAAFLTSMLTACGGGASGSGSVTPPGAGGQNTQSAAQQTEDSIASTEALGAPVQDFANVNDSTNSPLQSSVIRAEDTAVPTASGTCNNGVEFYAPDKNGDPNSTETQFFYDNACTGLARDVVRIWTSTGSSSETVQRTAKMYALNSSTPAAVRTETVNFIHASFDQYGYPVVKNGFDRSNTGELDVASVKTIVEDGEFVLAATSGNSTTFCSDSAGYNAAGISGETYGWAGLLPSGTRTVNSDGSVTWQSTHTGSTYTGSVGSFSIQIGAQNTACPISAPMFALAGGTLKGTFNIPVTATFARGILVNLTIANATLVNGDTLNVTTNTNLQPPDPHFISGTLTKSGASVASFNVNAFGDGVLTVAATGKQFVIDDWHVVR